MKKKKDSFPDGLDQLTMDMDDASKRLSDLTDDQEYTSEDLAILEELRHSAIKLKTEVEAIFDSLPKDSET